MNVTDLAALPVHEYAELFPMMAETEADGARKEPGPLVRLAADLEKNGCHTPVVLFEGAVLDGRNRIAAAVLAELSDLPTIEYTGSDPLAYVLSLNLQRRHLTRAQLVDLGRLIRDTMTDGRVSPSDEGGSGAEGRAERVAEALQGAVSRSTLERGWAVADQSPDLWDDVQKGKRSISDAYNQIRKPVGQEDRTVNPYERFEKLFDAAVSRISDLVADLPAMREDDVRYVTQALSGLIRQAEGRLQ